MIIGCTKDMRLVSQHHFSSGSARIGFSHKGDVHSEGSVVNFAMGSVAVKYDEVPWDVTDPFWDPYLTPEVP